MALIGIVGGLCFLLIVVLEAVDLYDSYKAKKVGYKVYEEK